MIRADKSIAFDYVQGVAMVISRAVEPSPGREPSRIDNQRIPFPMTVGPSHPAIGWRILWSFLIYFHVNRAQGVCKFVYNHDVICTLNDLKREGHVVGAGYTRAIALQLRVTRVVPMVVAGDINDHALVG